MTEYDDISIADDPEREELTAYLDGELDADARSVVEQRLAKDEDYRVRMRRMEDAWAMLDALPRTSADETFTQTTVEMVALAAQEEVATVDKAQRRSKWLLWGVGVAIVLSAGFFGYALVERATSKKNDQLVRDLPVIENVELYRHIDDIDFLRQLDAEGLFDDSVDVTGAGDESFPVDDAEADDAI